MLFLLLLLGLIDMSSRGFEEVVHISEIIPGRYLHGVVTGCSIFESHGQIQCHSGACRATSHHAALRQVKLRNGSFEDARAARQFAFAARFLLVLTIPTSFAKAEGIGT